jgi:hypothetical protein
VYRVRIGFICVFIKADDRTLFVVYKKGSRFLGETSRITIPMTRKAFDISTILFQTVKARALDKLSGLPEMKGEECAYLNNLQ